MADNEVKIYVTTDADLTDAEELQSLLDDIQAKAEETKDSLSDVGGDIDTTGADELADSLDEDKSNAEDLSSTLGGLDSTGLQEANSNAQELAGSLSDSAAGASELQTAMGAVAGAAAAGGLMEMVDTAGNINDSWNRLELTFGSVSDSMKQSIDSAAAATGRSGGTIRGYFNQMGIAGVTNTDLLSQSFESLSGRAYQTGNSIESMGNIMQKMVLSGNAGARQLTQLGISAEDLGRAMGVSAEEASKAFSALSQEDRLRVLTQAMGEGKQANEDYKNSWQGVKDQASAAFAGLMGAVGTPILQMLIPVMKTATQVVKMFTDGFKALPGPLQAVIGGIGAGVAVFAAFAGAIGVAGQVISGLKSGIEVIRGLSTVSQILSSVRSVLTAVNTALAASEWATLLPILLVAAAVIALIAILWYLYNTNEDVRNAIDGLGQALWGIGEAIYGTLMGALQWLNDQFQWLKDTFQSASDTITTYAPLVAQALFIMATGGVGAIILLIANFMGMPNQVGQALQNVINRVAGFIGNLVGKMANGARQAADNFIKGIRQMPGMVAAELDRIWQTVVNWGQNLANKFSQIGGEAYNALKRALGIGSPGYMFYMMEGELGRIEHILESNNIPSQAEKLGNDLVSSWGAPDLDFNSNTGSTGSSGSNTVSYTFNLYGDIDNEDRMQRFVDEVRRQIDWNNETAGRSVDL